MADLNHVRALRDAGRFSEALKVLESVRVGREDRLAADLLRAYLLERTGGYVQRDTLVQSRLADRAVTMAQRSQAELDLARSQWTKGDSDAAIESTQRAVRAALTSEDSEHLCWAELWLLKILSERASASAVAPILSTLR